MAKDCTTQHLKCKIFLGPLGGLEPQAVKVSHSRAHSLTDLPPKTCIIDPHLKMLLTQKVLLLLTFQRLYVLFHFLCLLLASYWHHRASIMHNLPGPLGGVGPQGVKQLSFIACSILLVMIGIKRVWALYAETIWIRSYNLVVFLGTLTMVAKIWCIIAWNRQ